MVTVICNAHVAFVKTLAELEDASLSSTSSNNLDSVLILGRYLAGPRPGPIIFGFHDQLIEFPPFSRVLDQNARGAG